MRLARRSEFLDYLAEQLRFVAGLRIRRMFGGYGVFDDALMFAIVVDDTLYLKADAEVRGEFEARGLSPFTYTSQGKTNRLHYYEAPPEVFEEDAAMRIWVDKALGAALRQGAKPKAARRAPNKSPPR